MWFSDSKKKILDDLKSDDVTGLPQEEAARRLTEYGFNKLKEKPPVSLLSLFVDQLKSVMIYVLLAAVVVTMVIGEYVDAVIILLVVILNAGIGVFQAHKAEEAIQSLKRMTEGKTLVRRDGEVKEISATELVPGDLVILEAGRLVPADMRLLKSINLQIDESALTGESVATEKTVDMIAAETNPSLGDLSNMAFMSTTVTYGRGEGIVVRTGMETEIGKIAGMLHEDHEPLTPLQKRLEELGRTLGFLAVGICSLILAISVFQGRDIFEMFLTAISLAVAAIPEGLPAIVAIVLALGVTRMSKANAIVRKLPAVETLGSVSVVCTDKTGTLTQNRMTVTQYYTDEMSKRATNELTDPMETKEQGKTSMAAAGTDLMKTLVLCADATWENGTMTGDPTEAAGLVWAGKNNISWKMLTEAHERVSEKPFDSERKLMSTLNREGEGYRVHTKGAMDNLLKISKFVRNGERIIPLTMEIQKEFEAMMEKMSNEALRVLGAAYKDVEIQIAPEEMEQDLVLLGFVGMIDPPRPEVIDSINEAKAAGITPVMITGDHQNTAVAIGKELGIAASLDQSITGREIDQMTVEEFNQNIHQYRVFARVSPEHKVKIVQAFQAHGHVVSMTGDGVNDAPSLKAADIGVAMGITGTDVSKGASDMVLTDDNFSTIIRAVREGRTIYDNIRKSVLFLLTCNLGEVVAIFVAILISWPVPLLPTQILWINLITDSLPAIALGLDSEEPGLMNKPPRPPRESIFAGGAVFRVLFGGLMIGTLTLAAFYCGLYEYGYHMNARNIPVEVMAHARTMAFMVLAGTQLFYALAMRSKTRSIFQIGLLSNPYLIGAMLTGFALQLMVVSVPFLARAFQLQMLSGFHWALVLLFAVIPLGVSEMYKLIRRAME
ncbi:cation-translocating P-type ATPase [Anoxynatronum buryatiense]|uniref:P-type Ca(2+) transporter n=1 Tax=Anoxynatronum buryatiense TaxID=489973 RepID=A0AA45WXE3_9CLOT|nr:cation-translocating P-type ATPase [Anoxynatronum buryatiense]SMP62553.1 Ca2+-transporting ATPase [Anoxynatronum buryatiense]